MIARWLRRCGPVAVLLLLGGCGPLPRPFQHEGAQQPLSAPQSLMPVSILAVDGMPDLPPLVVAALDQQDVAATVQIGANNFLRLAARIDGGAAGPRLHWQLIDADNRGLGEYDQALPPGGPDVAQQKALAGATAVWVARLLRADDLGGADLALRPKVAVDQVTVNGPLDAGLLKRALIDALQQKGLAVDADQPRIRVNGQLRITPALGGHDLVEVTWVVTDDHGVELGKVNQGSPVNHDDLVAHAMQMTHQIAAGGAAGVVELVRKRL